MYNTEKAIEIMREVCSACDAVFTKRISDAYLFGSYARGDCHAESDIDILLTVDEEPELLSAYRKQLSHICSRLSLEYDILISATVKSADQFRKYADVLPFYRNVLTEGIRYVAS